MLLAVMRDLADPFSRAAQSYANGRLQDGVEAPLDVLAQDAATAALEFLEAFDPSPGTSRPDE
ncbi:hypothetical protein [Cellulomonas bogoriensis]|uniref:Uncharacterized protein n=1 Tax=Cellulomonas bogoriensis 69B4 = DSM 16987 TaxID=1386082 RepID=A0A0A0BYX2_9CELL|nr:hypothetical protein [Cellulomonas bogoriensis]KGM12892.1 hypothetical protein N869_01060 [Cellulomonas bogoriensis 69B4 = DSM 16987]